MMSSFAPAVKAQIKARVALDGPTGSGKTWTALEWATVLAGGGKVALVDTERDSARLYAPHFAFDVCKFDPPYEVDRLIKLLGEADAAGYAVIVVDSLSHFWEGEGGVLDEVDAASKRAKGNTFAGWKHGTPLQRHMIDTFLGLDAHVIVTMRSKMEYVIEEIGGKQVPRKVGMAPVQRGGIEYEFQLVGDLDFDHCLTFSKSRCDVLASKMIQPGRAAEAAETFRDWLSDGEPPPPKAASEDVARHIAAVKAAPAEVTALMKGWMTDRVLDLRTLTVPELADANTALASFLLGDETLESGAPGPLAGSSGDGEQAEPVATPPGDGTLATSAPLSDEDPTLGYDPSDDPGDEAF